MATLALKYFLGWNLHSVGSIIDWQIIDKVHVDVINNENVSPLEDTESSQQVGNQTIIFNENLLG